MPGSDAPDPGETLLSCADVEAAADLLAGVVRRTPLEHSRALAEQVGGPVWLKCENLQHTGSFKIRGAYTRIARLTDEERARGVVAASAGNHAQGVALAARLLGARATVFMPETAPLPKVAATRGYGAEVRFVGQTLAEPLLAAAEHAEATGAVFIHGYYAEVQTPQSIPVLTNGTIVAKVDYTNEVCSVYYKDGALDYASYEQSTNNWEIPLWLVSSGTLTDLRVMVNPSAGLAWWAVVPGSGGSCAGKWPVLQAASVTSSPTRYVPAGAGRWWILPSQVAFWPFHGVGKVFTSRGGPGGSVR